MTKKSTQRKSPHDKTTSGGRSTHEETPHDLALERDRQALSRNLAAIEQMFGRAAPPKASPGRFKVDWTPATATAKKPASKSQKSRRARAKR